VKTGVILISGRGSNMRSIVEANTGLEVKAVISNRPDAAGLQWAGARGIPAVAMDHKEHASREEFDARLAGEIDRRAPDLVLLAGFMRILSPGFIARYEGRILNIHPSLLPSFPGLHTHRRALEAGVKIHGCTVHLVTPELDNGPIVIQAAVPVLAGDTEESLGARVLAAEHRIYPQAVRWFLEGRVRFPGEGVVQVRNSGIASDCLVSPRENR